MPFKGTDILKRTDPIGPLRHHRHEVLNDEAPRTVASRWGIEPVLLSLAPGFAVGVVGAQAVRLSRNFRRTIDMNRVRRGQRRRGSLGTATYSARLRPIPPDSRSTYMRLEIHRAARPLGVRIPRPPPFTFQCLCDKGSSSVAKGRARFVPRLSPYGSRDSRRAVVALRVPTAASCVNGS